MSKRQGKKDNVTTHMQKSGNESRIWENVSTSDPRMLVGQSQIPNEMIHSIHYDVHAQKIWMKIS